MVDIYDPFICTVVPYMTCDYLVVLVKYDDLLAIQLYQYTLSCEGLREQEGGDATDAGSAGRNGLHPRRLFPDRYEETLPYIFPQHSR